MLKSLSILCMIALAAPVGAQPPAPAQQTAAPSAFKGRDPNRIICERVEQIGSRLAVRKVCMSAREWQEQEALNRQELEKYQQQNTSVGTPGGSI